MSLVAHKYTPAEMSTQELEATFSGREHTVDFLLKSLRDQIHSTTLSSFVITGPRGAGKSTIIHMVALRISQDAELSAAWIPVVFPEEQFNLVSLRDLLAATLEMLASNQMPDAQTWHEKVEAEANEEQSQQIAVTGLRELTRQAGKRLVLFIENLNQLLEENLDDQMKGTLRRLLMTDPFMMVIGSTVHIFDSLKHYDEAFFNYFGQVPLDRLDAGQVTELLRKRATFDRNGRLLSQLPQQQAKVKTLVYLTGGNPRFVLMLYELLSLRQVTTIVQYLRRLVDELTPLLKDEMEHLPPQQRKIVHALMEKGGTAKPSDLTGTTRLPLNAITTQLKRLKEAQIVEVLGGGKGRAANYTVPDKLFSIWYQMRYLNQNRRRIELFVDVLRIWFEEEERVATLKLLSGQNDSTPHTMRECATTAEYFAASLKNTIHEKLAADFCIQSWIKTDLREAALVYKDFLKSNDPSFDSDEASSQIKLAEWSTNHDNPRKAIEILNQVLSIPTLTFKLHAKALLRLVMNRTIVKEYDDAISDCTKVIKISGQHTSFCAAAYGIRGSLRGETGDHQEAIDDFSTALGLNELSIEMKLTLLENRINVCLKFNDYNRVIDDCGKLIEWDSLQGEKSFGAYINRGIAKNKLGDDVGAIRDLTFVIKSKSANKDNVAEALLYLSFIKCAAGDLNESLVYANKAIRIGTSSRDFAARALAARIAIYIISQNKQKKMILDFVKILDLGLSESKVISNAISLAAFACFGTLFFRKDKVGVENILTKFARAMNLASPEIGIETGLSFLTQLASESGKDAWIIAWRSLATKLKSEIMEAINFLEPVCSILEGKDRSLLDALPPEQREFALEVLIKFAPKPETEPVKY